MTLAIVIRFLGALEVMNMHENATMRHRTHGDQQKFTASSSSLARSLSKVTNHKKEQDAYGGPPKMALKAFAPYQYVQIVYI